MTVTVRDMDAPNNKAGTNTASVTISVYENGFAPVFEFAPYSQNIQENLLQDTSIFRFTVTDADNQASDQDSVV